MNEKNITTDDVANVIINMSESTKICDAETAKGFKTSKKKDILKSNKEGSFSKFTKEIKKRQEKKEN